MKINKNINKFTALLCLSALMLSMSGCLPDWLRPEDGNSGQYDASYSTYVPSADDIQTSYAYESIDDEAVKNLYLQISDTLQKGETLDIVTDSELSEKQITLAIEAYKNDYPETFWLESNYSYLCEDGYTYIYLSSSVSDDELVSAKESFDTAVDVFMDNAPVDAGEYERVLYANNYITDNCIYDRSAAEISEIIGHESDAYGALVEGKAVCSGYSRAFQLLCEKLGVECVNIMGSGDGMPHQWNCVKIDGDWYNVDVTWNDNDEAGLANDYLNLSDGQFYQDHTADELFSRIDDEEFSEITFSCNTFIPECNSEKYNYYRMSYPLLYEFGGENDEEISSALAEAIENGDETFSFVIDDSSLDFESASYTLIDEGYALNYLDYARLKLWGQYQVSAGSAYPKENINVVTIILEYD